MSVYVHNEHGAIRERLTCEVCNGEQTEIATIQQMGGRTQDVVIGCRGCGAKGYNERRLAPSEELAWLRADRLETLAMFQEITNALDAALTRLEAGKAGA